METAPPVPPKDSPHGKRPLPAMSASTSKRKHEAIITYDSASQHEDAEQTPKRHRASPLPELEPSDSASASRQKTLRRKKGVKNLSTLNLRHEAKQAQSTEQQARGSKFQEGSLTDRPSQRPPSAFIRHDSGTLEQLDSLMSDYHDGTGESADETRAGGYDRPPEQTSAFYRFGQRLANNFRPVALWKQIWNETKEELTLKNIELERKRRQKIEAEQQYAHMKRTGQFRGNNTFDEATQRDSGVEFLEENQLAAFNARPGAVSRTDSNIDTDRTLRGRMHFTRPSISNLRLNLKKTHSDANLFGSSNRESSASMSPVKADADVGTLRKTQSRADLKKQHKLSKRVSDLEIKLNLARKELDEALIEASPAQGVRHERFAPLSSVRRKFVPGGLPSLPSERLLDAHVLVSTEKGNGEETIRAAQRKAYPRRAADLFDDEKMQQADKSLGSSNRFSNLAPMDSASVFKLSSPAEAGHGLAKTQANTPPTSDDTPHDAMAATRADVQSVSKPGIQEPRIQKRRSDREANDEPDTQSRPDKIVKMTRATVTEETSQHMELDAEAGGEQDQTDLFQHYADELAEASLGQAGNTPIRLSIDSTAHSLDPVYEEEEGMTTVPLNDDPSKPTAIATPARFGRITRSMSPVKHSAVKAAAEETMITRAADAVKSHRARQGTSRDAYEWPEDVF